MLTADSIDTMPQKPGVYLFKNRAGRVLYVGKAKDLHKRLCSYFSAGRDQAYKSWLILRNAHSLDHIITATEKEALILEGNLIKKYRPRYNVKIKDDSNYPLLKLDITNKYPRLSIVRRMKNDGALYYGPFTSSSAVRSTLRLLGPIFPLRKCKANELPKRSRPCLNFQLGRCLAPCSEDVSPEEYQEIVDQVKLFLEGRNRELLARLRGIMQGASRELDFEKAARVRDQIRAVEKTVERQTVVSSGMKDQDVIGLCLSGKEAGIVILVVRTGYMVGTKHFTIHCEWEDSRETMESFLKQYYRDRAFIPSEIILSEPIGDAALIAEWLSARAEKKVSLSVPIRGAKKKLVSMAMVNAKNILRERHNAQQLALLEKAKSVLKLSRIPIHIEGVDISNLRGDLCVASLVSFVRGVAQKSGYRNFRIKEVQGIDDYAMIAEVVKRRLKKGTSPDLFVIDGGKGHLSTAKRAIDTLGLESPPEVISIAKADRGETGAVDKIYIPNRKNPLMLSPSHPVLLFLMRIRDETHRRAVGYHRIRRKKRLMESELDRIRGVGPKRKKELLKYLGDIQSIAMAGVEEIKRVPGIDQRTAETIFDYFSGRSP
ncbi:MAG: excinuclease ABC subunit UvrC [Deltaproteobacteria bacterium]|nr:excinuclease ABC subunit UvrC [Deltaproteobacteria bacterium]MBW2077145.1 excinuclease ABC subunit UvrC [Deltaproteobacteria bacterium]